MNQTPQTPTPDQTPAVKKRSVGRVLLTCLHIFLIVLPVVACGAAVYEKVVFGQSLEQLLFYAGDATDSGASTFIRGALIAGPICLAVIAGLILLQYDLLHKRRTIRRTSKKTGEEKEIQVYPIRHKWLFTILLGILLFAIALQQIDAFSYLRAQFSESTFMEEQYVPPAGTLLSKPIKAPEDKRNILVIEVESLETTMFTKEQGGIWDHEVIPEMYKLLFDEDAIFFASDDGVRGTQDGYGSTWTTASLIANTAGIPFKVPVGMNNSYKAEEFLKGAYSLGDVLKENGYRNVLLSGCRTSFGGVQQYFSYHGNYEIIDPLNPSWSLTAGGTGELSIPASQTNEWGFSDEATFRLAQEFLSTEGDSDQPWHLFISTIDTHFTGYTYSAGEGYRGSETKFGRQLNNVYATTSRVVGEFVQWLREQPFYEDTTVVIVGDHINMLNSFCDESDNPQRGRYNVILNSVVTTENTKARSFTAFDFYPTILTAAGFTIKDDRLALGVDLFSDTPTLAETYGLDKMNYELENRSDFYVDYIMGRDDYEELESRADN